MPYAGVGQQFLDAAKVLPQGTPHARAGLAIGQMVGGVITMLGGIGGEVVGGLASTTGIGAALGVPAIVVSSGVVLGGAANVAAGARGLFTTGSGSSGPPEKTPAAGGAPSPRNGHLAGGTHPKTGVPFDAEGYPDFKAAGVVKTEVKIEPTGTRAGDSAAANKAAGLEETPEGYTWHHHQDRTTMQLVPTDIHRATGHTGGFSLEK